MVYAFNDITMTHERAELFKRYDDEDYSPWRAVRDLAASWNGMQLLRRQSCPLCG